VPIPFGGIVAPRGSPGAVVVAEVTATAHGTVALRGPMVPHHNFPSGAERSGQPHLAIGRAGLIDTGYTCRLDPGARTLIITGPPPGIVNVGGYRFPLHALQDTLGSLDPPATLAPLPDPLLGQRLIGNAVDRYAVQAALNAAGVNPIVAEAFHDRSEGQAQPRIRGSAGR
jgi:hypothetical protein